MYNSEPNQFQPAKSTNVFDELLNMNKKSHFLGTYLHCKGSLILGESDGSFRCVHTECLY